MRVIYKYQLDEAYRRIPMQKGARILHTAMQKHSILIWALVDPKAEKIHRKFSILPTGLGVPDDIEDMTYIGTVHTDNGLVWHIFDGGE